MSGSDQPQLPPYVIPGNLTCLFLFLYWEDNAKQDESSLLFQGNLVESVFPTIPIILRTICKCLSLLQLMAKQMMWRFTISTPPSTLWTALMSSKVNPPTRTQNTPFLAASLNRPRTLTSAGQKGGNVNLGLEPTDGKRKYVSYDTALGRNPGTTTCTSCQQQVTTVVTYKAGTYAWLMCLLFICCGWVHGSGCRRLWSCAFMSRVWADAFQTSCAFPQVGAVLLPDPLLHEQLQGCAPHVPPLQQGAPRREETVLQMIRSGGGGGRPRPEPRKHGMKLVGMVRVSVDHNSNLAGANRLGVTLWRAWSQQAPYTFFFFFRHLSCYSKFKTHAHFLFFLNEGMYINFSTMNHNRKSPH